MISGAGLCWQHVGGVGSTTTTYSKKYSHKIKTNKNVFTTELSMNTSVTHKLTCTT